LSPTRGERNFRFWQKRKKYLHHPTDRFAPTPSSSSKKRGIVRAPKFVLNSRADLDKELLFFTLKEYSPQSKEEMVGILSKF